MVQSVVTMKLWWYNLGWYKMLIMLVWLALVTFSQRDKSLVSYNECSDFLILQVITKAIDNNGWVEDTSSSHINKLQTIYVQ